MNEILLAEQGKKDGTGDPSNKSDTGGGGDGEENGGEGGSCSSSLGGGAGGGGPQQSSQASQTWICDIFQVSFSIWN